MRDGGATNTKASAISNRPDPACTLVAFLSYMGGLFAPVQGLTGTFRTLRTALVSIDQVFTILDTPD